MMEMSLFQVGLELNNPGIELAEYNGFRIDPVILVICLSSIWCGGYYDFFKEHAKEF